MQPFLFDLATLDAGVELFGQVLHVVARQVTYVLISDAVEVWGGVART